MERPIKTVTTIMRGVPRGQVSFGGGRRSPTCATASRSSATPFGGGDLNGPSRQHDDAARSWCRRATERRRLHLVARRSRAAEALLSRSPARTSYRVEAIYEHDAWRNDKRVAVPRLATRPRRVGRRSASRRT